MERCKCNPFCNKLDERTKSLLCENVTINYMKPKQIQNAQGNQQLEFISEGVILTFTLLEDGSQESIELVRPGDILGTHLLTKDIAYPDYHTLSLTEVKKCQFPLKVIERLFRENKQFAEVLLKNIAQQHARNSIHWVTMHSKKGEDKVEYIYRELQEENVDMSIITQDDLALLAGVSRITVARAMKRIFKNH